MEATMLFRPRLLVAVSTLVLLAGLSGCEVVEGIFKVGVWAGVLLVVAILLGVLWVVRKLRR
jgi:hypothetical protein